MFCDRYKRPDQQTYTDRIQGEKKNLKEKRKNKKVRRKKKSCRIQFQLRKIERLKKKE